MLNREPLASMEYDTILKAVQTNYMGTVNVALRARPYLQRTRGKLIFFTSSSYTRGRAFYGISINCINPERTKTPMRQQNFGIEPDETLLMPERVAEATLRTLLTDCTGQVIDVRRPAAGK